MRLIALLALAGCSHRLVQLQPVELAHASGKLHRQGQANVIAYREGTPMLETVAMTDTFDGATVASLLADCPPMAFDLDGETAARYPRCALFSHRDLTLRDERQLAPTVRTTLAAAAAAGVVTCAFVCSSPYNYAADGVLALSGAAVAVGIGVLIYTVAKMD